VLERSGYGADCSLKPINGVRDQVENVKRETENAENGKEKMRQVENTDCEAWSSCQQ
jgi:hypothetical protein